MGDPIALDSGEDGLGLIQTQAGDGREESSSRICSTLPSDLSLEGNALSFMKEPPTNGIEFTNCCLKSEVYKNAEEACKGKPGDNKWTELGGTCKTSKMAVKTTGQQKYYSETHSLLCCTEVVQTNLCSMYS